MSPKCGGLIQIGDHHRLRLPIHVAVLLGVAGDAIGLAAPGAEGDEPDQQRGLACLAAQVIHVAGTTRAALNDDPMDVRMRNV
jgi:hypothetical protein